MTVRRFTALAIATSSLGVFCAAPAFAGLQAPKDMIATPSVGPIGQNVLISNAGNSPCGGQVGDGPAQVDVTITKPDSTVLPISTVPTSGGNWSIGFINTDQVGDYHVTAICAAVVTPPAGVSSAQATGFTYTPTSFTIQAAQVTTTTTSTSTTTSTTAPTTTSTIATTTTTAAAQPAVAAAATPSFTG